MEFVNTDVREFDSVARREMVLSIDRDTMRKIKETRLSDDQVDEMMDEADRRAVARGEEAPTKVLERTEGDPVAASRIRQKQAIDKDRESNEERVRPSTHMATLELLARVIRHSEFTDYDVKGPVTRLILDAWIKVFVIILNDFMDIVRSVAKSNDDELAPIEAETITYLLAKYLFNIMASTLNEFLSTPSLNETLLDILNQEDVGTGHELLILFLLEDSNYEKWHVEWGRRLEKSDMRGFVMETFVARLWNIAHTRSLDSDQSEKVTSIVSKIEKRLDWSKDEKSRRLQGLRDATTVATYVETA